MHRPIIIVAPNGARKTKEDLPQIPLWPEELAIEAENCVNAGASLFHLHIRDENQGHTLDVDTYKRTIDAIRNRVGDKLIIQATSESCGIYEPEQQMKMVKELKPEAVSLALREFIPRPDYEVEAEEFFTWVKENKIFAQYILYNPDELKYFADLADQRIIPEGDNFVLFVLGKKQRVSTEGNYAKPEDLNPWVDTLKNLNIDINWAICAFGGNENACVQYAVENGGNARIGFENNHLFIDQTFAPSNAALVEQFVKTSGTEPLSAAEVRAKFGIK